MSEQGTKAGEPHLLAGQGGAPGSALAFPDCVPTLVDTERGVTLRAHDAGDLQSIVEQVNDPVSRQWTSVPPEIGDYSLADARRFLFQVVPDGWATRRSLRWAIEAQIDGTPRFCGSIDLWLGADQEARVGFGLHPAARGRSVMSSALRMVRDHAFDDLGMEVIRWRSPVGNWPSRRVAAAAGFRFDGTVRDLLVRRRRRIDGWLATLNANDPRAPLRWLEIPVLSAGSCRLRPFAERDLDRIVEATNDPRTQYWLASLPYPYGVEDAEAYLGATRELSASRSGIIWCVADPVEDRCLGAVSLEGFGGYSRRVEIGYWTHPAARGRGLMTTAVRAVTRYAEDNDLVDSVLIRCAAGNSASRQVAESAGYRAIGVQPRCEPLGDGSLSDLVLYARP
ncbi:MAG TPA: GNAT family N-acetyltransferase [Propionibacteriaceae bacterium]|nr:GNAT family N-acetyltransferase [Propionibacteriaceae bacterium]